jgi:membrane-associated phospholipid phosphatase
MFPAEKEFLKARAAEHLQSRQWAGTNTKSDLVAGENLGKAVAAKYLQRSKTDGMKYAIGTRAQWDSLYYAATARYGNVVWKSLETPFRPPMLPFFGKVKSWCYPDITVVRPAAPPAVASDEFEKNVNELIDISKNLTPEQRRIANYWADGTGTYTPPGHWNRAAADYIIENKENPLRTARTFAYLNIAIMDAGISCWDTKYHYYYPRPAQVNRNFKSLLGTPNFPAYTSGHSTFSAAAATVLGHIYPTKAAEAEAMAKQASDSRIYGGIHYRFDCEIGLQVGKTIGNASKAVAIADGAE